MFRKLCTGSPQLAALPVLNRATLSMLYGKNESTCTADRGSYLCRHLGRFLKNTDIPGGSYCTKPAANTVSAARAAITSSALHLRAE